MPARAKGTHSGSSALPPDDSPFLVARGSLALAASAAVRALGLFGIGAAITIFTGAPVWRSGGRQLGLAAAGVTFGLGRLIGRAFTG